MKIHPFHITPLPWRAFFTHFRHYGFALLIFLVGLLISLVAFRFYHMQDINRTRAEFDRLADIRLFFIREMLKETLEQLEIIKQFYYSVGDVSQQEFNDFVDYSFNLYPNLLAIGWIDGQHPSKSRGQPLLGLDFFNFTTIPNPQHYHFVPFDYLKLANLQSPFYLDNKDYPTFLALLKRSQQLSSPIISYNISFFQNGQKQGFFLFDPVFFKQEKDALSQTNRLRGVLVGFSNFDSIVRGVRSRIEPVGMNIGIYDISAEKNRLLYWSQATILQDSASLSAKNLQLQEEWAHSHIFRYGNRLWKLKATPTLGFIYQHQRFSHWEVPIIGILISGLTAFYFLILVNRRILTEQEVQERTEELGTINRILQQEIHERQLIEEEITRKQRYLQRRHEALEYLTKLTTSELRHAINEIILRTASVMQINRASVWFHETVEQTQVLTCAGLYVLSSNSFTNHLELSSTDFPHYFQALAQHAHLMIPSSQNPPLNQELSSYLAAFHIISKLDIPILFEGKLLGVLSCEETRGHRGWLLEDRHFGQTIADIIAIMIEQSARRKVEKALQESEERLRFVTQKAIDGIISLNEKEEIISWNYGAEKMFGYTEIEILGKSLHLVILQDLKREEIASKPIELKGIHQDGHIFPIEVSQTRWKSGDAFYDTIIVRDITERKENEKHLIQAMREARAANAAKDEFLATVSHELRTPLNAIIGFNQCLLMGMDGAVNESQRGSLEKIEKSSFHLLSLINDVLDLAKIEAQKMEIEIEPHNIVDIVTSCIEYIQPLVNQKNLSLDFSLNKSFIFIEVDSMRIRQVLLNLLSNAVKFTEKGSIHISLLDQPNQIEIRIADTGIGLSPEELAKIFHPFSQADSSITRKYGGTGLGLVISKKIINLHGGTIRVESQKGQGSTFIITLPKK